MLQGNSDRLAISGVPQTHCLIMGGGDDVPAIRTEPGRIDFLSVSCEYSNQFAISGIPQAYLGIIRGRRDLPTIRTKSDIDIPSIIRD